MKRIFALLFVTTLVGQAWAYDFKYGDLYYNITGDNMVEVTYQYENSIFNYAGQTEIKIPEKVIYSEVEYVVTSIGDASFKKCNDLVSISIPNSITTIGSSAFEECGLTSVCIPNSVIRIERSAFMNCKSLISANIPNTVTHIGDWAFRYCTELKYMTIGNSVEYIGNDVFWECAKLDYNIYDNGCYLGNEENPYFILLNSKRNNISSCQINNRCHIIYNAF
ncbi:MAG: leucine-rich repeat domain-containing protein, partial [Salinivirgaceae bacterium]|nr:leucine-rich repeat domain-containing protein [Salinivirgaceae bacterium]